ncbi:MAG: glycerol-3-phosphate 1-O-acyltransferase PlsY [Candidatus Zixiibacteriota bacterium]
MELLVILAPVVIAYLLGAVPFGLIVARLYGVPDIRQAGSGNIGATNVWRIAGPRAALWVYLLDIGKGVTAIMIARQFHPTLISYDLLLVICAVAAVIGNVFPVYLRFRGGKGVNTSLGVMITLLPVETLIALAVFLLTVLIFRYISLGSILAAVGLLAVIVVEKYMMNLMVATIYLYLSITLALLVILSHRQNIGRLLSGKENRLTLPWKTKQAGSHV